MTKGQKAFDNPKEYNRAKEAFFKQLFKKINEDFAREINEALKEFNATIPAEVKAQMKASVQA